jgi:hypothetical protein
MARRIKKANIRFISLCPKGANQLPVLYKDDGAFEFQPLVKGDMEKGEIQAVVYAPELRDSQGDVADETVIRDMAHNFLKSGEGIDIRHNGKPVTKDQAHVAESFIIQKGDDRFKDMRTYSGMPVDVTGGWGVIIKVDDPTLRQEYRDGKWNGVSMGGSGVVQPEDADNLITKFVKSLASKLGLGDLDTKPPTPGDQDMEPKELSKQIESLPGAIAKAVVEATTTAALAKAAGVADGDTAEVASAKITLHKAGVKVGETKPATGTAAAAASAEDKPAQKPIFKGEITDEKAVAQFEYDLAKWEIESKVDKADPKAIKEAATAIAKLTKPGESAAEGQDAEDQAAGIKKDDSDEVKTLRRQLHKAEKRSNQPAPGTEAKPGTGSQQANQSLSFSGISKADQDGIEVGNRMAQFANANTTIR